MDHTENDTSEQKERNTTGSSRPLVGMNDQTTTPNPRRLFLVASMGHLVHREVAPEPLIEEVAPEPLIEMPPPWVYAPVAPTPDPVLHCDKGQRNDGLHDWEPIPNRTAQYQCKLCKKIGRRELYGMYAGKIVLRKSALPPLELISGETYVSSKALRKGTARKGRSGPGSY